MPVARRVDPGERASPAAAGVIGNEAIAQRPVGHRLQGRVDRRTDREAAFVERIVAVARQQPAAHLLGEVRGLDEGLGRPRPGAERRLHGGLGLGGAHRAVRDHLAEHPVAPPHRRLALAHRVIVVRRLRQGGQIGDFLKREVVEGAVEIVERRRRHAIRARSEIDLVEIELENPVLGEGILDPHREDGFLDLAREGELAREQEVLRHLLGDRRRAHQPAVAAQIDQVRDHRVCHAQRIDPEMLVERLVLGGEKGLDHPARHGDERHEQTLLAGMLGEQPPVAGVHPGHHRRLVGRKLVVIRQVAAIVEEHEGDGTAGESGEQNDAAQDDAEDLHPCASLAV